MTNQPYMAGSKRVNELITCTDLPPGMPADLKGIARECQQDSINWFPDKAFDLFFQASCAMAEAGEAVNQIKKVERGTHTYEELRPKIAEEAVDTLIYLMNVFALLDIDPLEAYRDKRRVNKLRFGSSPSRGRSGLRGQVGPENGDGG